MHITVLGGGPGGCAVGYYAKKNGLYFTIYEATNECGGFCRTLRHGDFYYDTGAHRFHDKIPDVTHEVKQLLGPELKKIYVPSQIWANGKFIDFPLSPLNLARNLGLLRFCKAVVEVIRARLSNPDYDNFTDFARYTYGNFIAERFLINYSEKIWGTPCLQLSPKIAGKRLQGLDLRTFVKETIFGKRAKTRHLDGAFYYPIEGYGRIVEKLIAFCGEENIKKKSKITKILCDNKRITAIEINNHEVIEVDEIVSTLPLNVVSRLLLPAPSKEILELANHIYYRDLILIVLFLDKESITKNATVYFPDSDFPFTRVYEPKNRSQTMSPLGKTSLVIELPSQHDDSYWKMSDDALIQLASSKLLNIGWFNSDQIIDIVVKRIPFAYPILEKDSEKKVEQLVAYLAKFNNLKLSGRNGKFMYTHLHNMMALGKKIVEGYVNNSKRKGR